MAHLEINNVNKIFGKTRCGSGFQPPGGKGRVGLLPWSSGCGKTTTLRMVAGFEIPTSGHIVINGKDVTNDKPPNQRNVGMVFQAYALFPNMTVADNIGFGMKIRQETSVSRSRNVWRKCSTSSTWIALATAIPTSFPVGSSSVWPWRAPWRLALRCFCWMSPSLPWMPRSVSRCAAEIRAIQQQLGITAIYVTHDQEEALSISDRVVVMYEGRMEQVGTPFEIYNFPQD